MQTEVRKMKKHVNKPKQNNCTRKKKEKQIESNYTTEEPVKSNIYIPLINLKSNTPSK